MTDDRTPRVRGSVVTAARRAIEAAKRVAGAALTGWWAGAIAGLALAIVEAVHPATSLGYAAEAPGTLLAYLGLLASLYVVLGSLIGALLGGSGALLYHETDLGDWVRAFRQRRRERREADPIAFGRARLAHAVAASVAAMGWVAGVAFFIVFAQRTFHHQGLIAALDAAVAGGLLGAAAVVWLVVARVLDLAARALGRSRPARWLASAPAAAIAVAAVVAAAVARLVVANQSVVEALRLRPPLLGLAFAGLLAVAALVVLRTQSRAAGRPCAWRKRLAAILPPATLAVLLGVAVALGELPSARHTLGTSSSFGLPAASAIRRLVDLDRDGSSPIFGGGDCNDLDPEIGKDAFDWPDDGVDQNCLGGDSSSRPPEPAPFHPVPDSVPRDLNVVLISLDSVRADHLGCFGYRRPTSATMDALAREGVLFRAGYTTSSSTRYALSSLLTGRYPISQMFAERRDRRTWPKILAERGYVTAAVMGHAYFNKSGKLMRDFQIVENSLSSRFKQGEVPLAAEQTDKAIDLVETRLRRQRFFLWAHYMDTHFLFARIPGFSFGSDLIGRYDGEIRHTDHHIGRLFEALRRLELWDRTVVIVIADHGQGLGEHGVETHAERLYQSLVRVPFIVRVPGIASRVVDEPVSHADLLPTVLNLLRGEPSEALDGASTVGLMTGRDTRERQVFAEVEMPGGRRWAIIGERWKLIYNAGDDTFELYDIVDDPGELRNLVATRSDVAAELMGPLARHMERATLDPQNASLLRKSISSSPPRRVAHRLDARLGDAIQVLGYDVLPSKVRRGQSFRVSIFFKSLERLPGSHKIFTHVYWPGARRYGNLDHHPVDGAYPIRFWPPRQYIRDEFEVRTSPGTRTGKVRIHVGVYEGSKRLEVSGDAPVDKARTAIVIEGIEVVP